MSKYASKKREFEKLLLRYVSPTTDFDSFIEFKNWMNQLWKLAAGAGYNTGKMTAAARLANRR